MSAKKFIIVLLILPILQGCIATFQTAQTLKRGESEKIFAVYYPFSYRMGVRGGLSNWTELEFMMDGIVFLPPFPHSFYLGLKQKLISESFVSSAMLARAGFSRMAQETGGDYAYQADLLLSLSAPQNVLTLGAGVIRHPAYPFCDFLSSSCHETVPAYHLMINLKMNNTPPKKLGLLLEVNLLEMFEDEKPGRIDEFTAGAAIVWK